MVNDSRTLLVLLAALGLSASAHAQQLFGDPTNAGYMDAEGWRSPEITAAAGVQTEPSQESILYNYYQNDSLQNAYYPQPEVSSLPPGLVEEEVAPSLPSFGRSFRAGDHTTLAVNGGLSGTVGARLDTSYRFLRDMSAGAYMSEHQSVFTSGFTALPLQTPTTTLGLQWRGTYIENNSMTNDEWGFSIDAFAATRYKSTYLKVGPFYDYQNHFGKVGPAFSMLTNLPLVSDVTIDSAFGIGLGNDEISADLTRRVEVADLDAQLRVGRYWAPNFQAGFSGNYLTFDYTEDEWGAGAYSNIDLGRFQIGLDVTGGKGGLRGYANVSLSWGRPEAEHPFDPRHPEVDTVAWVTRPTLRDVSVRLRESDANLVPSGGTGGDDGGGGTGPSPGCSGVGVGNLLNVCTTVQLSSDADADGVIDPGDIFRLNVELRGGTQAETVVVSPASTTTATGTGGIVVSGLSQEDPSNGSIVVSAGQTVYTHQLIPSRSYLIGTQSNTTTGTVVVQFSVTASDASVQWYQAIIPVDGTVSAPAASPGTVGTKVDITAL